MFVSSKYPYLSCFTRPTCVLLADGLLQGLIQRLRAQRVADQQQDVHLVLPVVNSTDWMEDMEV